MAKMRRAVFPRDHWRCRECGLRIPPTTEDHLSGRYAPQLGDIWLELDHITPHLLGGLFIESNLRAACSTCNRSKGASTTYVDWPTRIEHARSLLESGDPIEATARAAVRALTGGDS